jgi:hypothetical protein
MRVLAPVNDYSKAALGMYIMNPDHTVRLTEDSAEWGRWMQDADRVVARYEHTADIHVSTAFLGLDHDHMRVGRPILFETMVFGGEHDESRWRCCTWEEAQEQHMNAIALVMGLVDRG